MTVTNKALASLPLSKTYIDFENWSKEVTGKDLVCCAPRNADELVTLANWAYKNGYTVRAVGFKHNWSPLTIANGNQNEKVILVDLTRHLNKVTITKGESYGYFTAQAGIDMETLLTKLEKKGYGFYSTPAPGDLTLGGILTIDGHGTCTPANGETKKPGGTYGTVSNAIMAMTIMAWNEQKQSYELKTLQRNDPEIAPYLTALGRTLVYDVTMQVPVNDKMRCESIVDIHIDELFAPETKPGMRTMEYYLNTCGRAEAIWFPFTEYPWMKTWTISPKRPRNVKQVNSPFNYSFSDQVPVQISDLIKSITNNKADLTPALGNMEMELVKFGLRETLTSDLWGWSKNLLLYVRPDTLRVTANGYAIITSRAKAQRAIHDFIQQYLKMVDEYKARNSYPMSCAIEIRVTGLDKPEDSVVPGAVTPALSAARPVEGHPERDVAIWIDNLTMPDTPDALQFYIEMEEWVFNHYNTPDSTVRVEWSKGWGYGEKGAWTSEKMLTSVVPSCYPDWNKTIDIFDKNDPHKIFTSPFMRKLLVKR
ncbi:cholesterol oxidase substrate-binding domain-containing protein [Mixta tenebrionis]|uniref:FAD-binding protein n=1 Tax=Mixta tenebrionis TaxID=2562439 RepID=A0A506V6X3_9GAMM|nr:MULTISPECIES: cholesterol oxidase substrate-binding domain-containing protein [Mixta]QHM76436.1 hypothetical protein C7M52_02412 [Mixta theicola]TPW41395.1 FAD-binding protein [Mixta tenebrionis]